jgi:hypothetical protein
MQHNHGVPGEAVQHLPGHGRPAGQNGEGDAGPRHAAQLSPSGRRRDPHHWGLHQTATLYQGTNPPSAITSVCPASVFMRMK